MSIFTVFLKNRNFISKISISKVTDYAALVMCNYKNYNSNKELKGERDINLIKLLAFPVAMRFIVYRYEESIKIMFLTKETRLHSYEDLRPKANVIATHA